MKTEAAANVKQFAADHVRITVSSPAREARREATAAFLPQIEQYCGRRLADGVLDGVLSEAQEKLVAVKAASYTKNAVSYGAAMAIIREADIANSVFALAAEKNFAECELRAESMADAALAWA